MTQGVASALPKRVTGIDKLDVAIALILAAAWLLLPFADFKPNRILPGEPRSIFSALPPIYAATLAIGLGLSIFISLLKTSAVLRLLLSFVALVALALAIGDAGYHLTPEGDKLARVAPGAGSGYLRVRMPSLQPIPWHACVSALGCDSPLWPWSSSASACCSGVVLGTSSLSSRIMLGRGRPTSSSPSVR